MNLKEAWKKWHQLQLNGDPDICPHKAWEEVAFEAGWEAAIAAVKESGPVAEVHPNNIRPSENNRPWCREVLLYSGNSPHDFLDGKNYRIPLYRLPEVKS